MCGSAVTRLITSVSCTAQPSRAHASVTDDTCGNTDNAIPAEQPDQRGADTVQQRVTTGHDVNVAVDVVEKRRQCGQQR